MIAPRDDIPEDSSAASGRLSQEFEPRIVGLLIERVEQLARELGRNEARQIALEQQITRLEQQMATLRRQSASEQ